MDYYDVAQWSLQGLVFQRDVSNCKPVIHLILHPWFSLSTTGETATEKHSALHPFTAPLPSTQSYAHPPLENLFWKTREHNPGTCSPPLLPLPLLFPPDAAIGPDLHLFRGQFGEEMKSQKDAATCWSLHCNFVGEAVRIWGPRLRSRDSQAWPPSAIPWPVMLCPQCHT